MSKSGNLDIDVSLLSEHDGVLEVEVQQDDHFAVARLVERVLDVVVQDVNLKSGICKKIISLLEFENQTWVTPNMSKMHFAKIASAAF